VTCDEDALYLELAFVAAHCHWPLSELLDLEHATRARFIQAINDMGIGR
jgi:hypothetical protein